MPRSRYVLLSACTFAAFFGLWTVLSTQMEKAAVFLPGPWVVAKDALTLVVEGDFIRDVGASVWRVTIGYLVAVLVAFPLGVLAGTSKMVDALIQPFNDFVRYMPVAAFIPLTILWVGIGDEQKMLIIFMGTVFQLLPMIADTANRVPRHLVELAYTTGAPQRHVISRVVIPWSLPEVYDHCRIALGWAWSYLVVAELVAANSGIGHVIIQSQRFIHTGNVIVGILAIGLIGLAFDQAFRLPKKLLFRWI